MDQSLETIPGHNIENVDLRGFVFSLEHRYEAMRQRSHEIRQQYMDRHKLLRQALREANNKTLKSGSLVLKIDEKKDGRFYVYWKWRYFLSREKWVDRQICAAGDAKGRPALMKACTEWERPLVEEFDDEFVIVQSECRFLRNARRSLIRDAKRFGIMLDRTPLTIQEILADVSQEELRQAISEASSSEDRAGAATEAAGKGSTSGEKKAV